MKKHIIILLSMLLVIGAIMAAPVFSQPDAPDFAAAEAFVVRFCDHLKTGKTGAILGNLDGTLLKKRARLLGRSYYRDLIAQRYRDADFQIEEIIPITATRMAVNLVVTFQSDSIQNNWLIVDQDDEGNYKIFDEKPGHR